MMQHTWVFQLSRPLNSAEKSAISAEIDAFLAGWKSHGSAVPGFAKVAYDRFVIVQAVPGTTSGCSIDSMTRSVTDILAKVGLQTLGAEVVFFKQPDGQLSQADFREIPKLISEGVLNADTVVFDSSLGQKGDIALWERPLSQTWMSRYIPVNVNQ